MHKSTSETANLKNIRL